MEFQSLSQIRLTVDTLKAIIWEACDQNEKKVTASVEQFLRMQNISRDHSNDPPQASLQDYVENDENELYEAKSDVNSDIVYDNNTDVSPTKLQQSPSKPLLTFDEFKVSNVILFSMKLILTINRKQIMVQFYTNHMYKHVMNYNH